jgi:hypothetical protein
MYNLNYTPTNLGVQSWREIISEGTWTKKVEYHWSRTGRDCSWLCISDEGNTGNEVDAGEGNSVCDTVVEVEASDNVLGSDKHDLEVCAVTISGLKFLTLHIIIVQNIGYLK